MAEWLRDKRALVVGAGSGIGLGVVDAFRSEGAAVAVLEKSPEKTAAFVESHPDCPATVGDATTRAANDEAVESGKVATAWGFLLPSSRSWWKKTKPNEREEEMSSGYSPEQRLIFILGGGKLQFFLPSNPLASRAFL